MYRILAFIVIFSFTACKKTKQQSQQDHPVPYVQVDITLYPNDPLYFKLQGIGGWMYINGGINGIVVYRKSTEEFLALERTSPQLPNDPKARVVALSDNYTLKDTISGSKWRMLDAAVLEGPAEWPLRTYGTVYDGNSLRIRN